MTEARKEREQRFERHMSDAEALMWNVEKDPWLNPSGGMVTICDRPIDIDQFRQRLRYAVSRIPRLREHVVPGVARLTAPMWAPDAEFDFDYHLRHVTLPLPGTERQLFDLATRLYEDPFDRTRPLWLFVVIDGLEGGRGALFWKAHHSISDGIGMVRLSERYMERTRDAELPADVDLDALIADEVAQQHEAARASSPGGVPGSAIRTAGGLLGRQIDLTRRVLGEMSLWGADPRRPIEGAGRLVGGVQSTVGQLRGGGEVRGGSPLWSNRSRRRHLEALSIPLEDAKAAGKVLGGSINDVFVAGAVAGAVAYHEARGVEVDAFNISFVVSTRADNAAGGNAFTPTRVQVPGGRMSVEERFESVRDNMAAKRQGVTGAGAMSHLAGVANRLPTSVVTRVARSQAARMDFATSNLRAAPFPMYISGAEVLQNVTMGPVAGTAFNLTTISYNGRLDMGVFIDPAAVEDPADLRRCLLAGYREVLAAGGVVLADEPGR